MIESIHPDPKNPDLIVALGPPHTEIPRRGVPPRPQIYGVESVTLNGGTFVPNHEHALVTDAAVRHGALDGLSLVAGGLSMSRASTVLFGPDGTLANVRGRLMRLQERLGSGGNPGLVNTAFDNELLQVAQPIQAMLAPDRPDILPFIEAIANELDEDDAAASIENRATGEIGLTSRYARTLTLETLGVHTMEAAVAVYRLTSPPSLGEEPRAGPLPS